MVGCGAGAPPDPRTAARQYQDAVHRGDAAALRMLLTDDGQKAHSQADVAALLRAERQELTEAAGAVTAPDVRVASVARLRFDDGEEVSLDGSGGPYRVAGAGALPGGARSPEEALDQLRRVLARRSYAGLMRVLSPTTRAAVEQDLRSLVEGLERADTLPVELVGDSARVDVPGGHHVRLKKDGKTWRVDDFD